MNLWLNRIIKEMFLWLVLFLVEGKIFGFGWGLELRMGLEELVLGFLFEVGLYGGFGEMIELFVLVTFS
jgi:hypothetical protein